MELGIALDDELVACKDAVWCDLKGEVVVLLPSSGVYFGLEGSGVEIWQAIQVPCTARQIVNQLTSKFEVTADTCRTPILEFVEELARRGLVLVNKNVGVA